MTDNPLLTQPVQTSDGREAVAPNCPEPALIEWLEDRIAADIASLAKAQSEVAAFNARTERENYDWSPLANSWQADADRCAERLGRWTAMRDIIRDRDEWREQHENLLSVRQSDLAALTLTDGDPSSAVVEVVLPKGEG